MTTENVISMPNDIDLDYKATNVILKDVTRTQNPQEGTMFFEISFREGQGCEVMLLSDEGFEHLAKIDDLKLQLGFAGIPQHMFEEMNWSDEILFFLEGWKSDETLLQLVSSPGGTYTIYENEERWIPLPRVKNEG